jgi:uncharacterized protein (TIGR02145 family)
MSFTDATETPGIMKCIPMTGSIDFSVPPNIVKGVTASFVLNNQPTAPNPTSVTYRWAAPDFSPATYAGRTYTATVPGIAGTYPITLTAQSERYCDIAITKDVEVLDCDAPGSTVNFTAFSPCSNASTGDYWYLADTREEAYNNTQMYKVKKMADGRIWMVQDLKFGDKCTKTTFTGSTSDQQGNVSNTFPEHYGDCRYNPTSGAGYFYDWAAVLNKAGAYSGGPDVGCNGTGISAFSCQGLCPSDWHIPTYDEAIAYNLLYGTSCASSPCWWNNNDIMEIVPSGNWLGTGVDYPQFVYISLSTQANSTSMWMFDSGSCNANGICPNRRKNGGIVARCLMNY